MTILDPTTRAVMSGEFVALLEGGTIRLSCGSKDAILHPNWLRDRSTEPGQVDPTNHQRLFNPHEIEAGLSVTDCSVSQNSSGNKGSAEQDHLAFTFSDGHLARLELASIARAIGWDSDPEEPPVPEAWTTPVVPFSYVDWRSIGWSIEEEDVTELIRFLDAFYRHGYVVLRNTPTDDGSVGRIAARLGYLVGTNFDSLFDVRVEQQPSDLAFTAVELLAHTDLPYRKPVPGIQMLHCLINEAPGGDSTLVDGLAAASALKLAHPRWHEAMVNTEVEYRYDIGRDTVVNRGYTIEYFPNERFRQIRYNTKLDTPTAKAGEGLNDFYAGRLWLNEWLNNPEHQVTFRLEPGDVMFMDNHRVLHGRTSFDSSKGRRHLQGCYIEHDGPDTLYRLAVRRASGGIN